MSTHNAMPHNNNVDQDRDTMIYQTYPCGYYVQSPSTIRNDVESTFHSPIRSETHPLNPSGHEEEPSRFALCQYSSKGSSHSFMHHKKISYDGTITENNDMMISRHVDNGCDGDDGELDEEEGLFLDYYFGKRKGGWRRYFSYSYADSCAWIFLQMSWRLVVSFWIALLVFYIATKPPSPNFSLEISKIQEFKLGEGVDRTGVTTKILTCNCSMNLVIENKSRFFGLHIRPPLMDMKFSVLPFAFASGPELYAESGLTIFPLELGVKNKPMYGAGRSMQDMLDSGRGLPIAIRVNLRSRFQVVPNLIKPKFHHRVECIVVLKKTYDKKHRTQAFNSTCKVVTS